MIRIGVIGGIGSGKSFIAKLFNCPVFNADREVNILYKNSFECYKKLSKKLPRFVKSFPISKIQLITNNPDKISQLEKYDIDVTKRVPLALNANPHNQHYLKTKQKRTGHLMDSF